MTPQEQILEAQAKLKELYAQKKEIQSALQKQLESEVNFPIYLKADFLTAKVMSFTDCVYITDSANDISRSSVGNIFLTNPHTLITEEEFNAKRTEALQKLSEL